MARHAPAAFLFYPRDYLANLRVHAMTYEARGIYWQLCCLYWIEQQLPDDVEYLARVLKVPRRKLHKLWPQLSACFQSRNGGLRHKGLDDERLRQAAWAAKCSVGGKIGAARRWAKTHIAHDRGSHPVVTQPDDYPMTLPLPCPLEEQEHQEQRLAPPSQPVEKPNVRVLLRLAHELHGERFDSEADLKEALKQLAARHHLAYDAPSIAAVLDLLHRSRRPLMCDAPSAPRRRAAGGAR